MKTSRKVGGAVAAALLALSSQGAALASPGIPAHEGALTGKTVFLDPGHQGANNPAQLNRQVPDGRGGMKACETGGMTTVTGVPEHTITWQVAQLVKQRLEQAGARVVLSRQDDTGWGGCINERAEAENNSGASLGVNIHADSTMHGTDTTKQGFHIIVPTLPLPDATANKVQSWEGRKAAYLMRDAMLAAGFPASNYLGKNGIDVRSDITGVNMVHVPDLMIEMGNGANPKEAAELTSPQGQQRYAAALADGITRYLAGGAPAQTTQSLTSAKPSSAESSVRGGFDVDFVKGEPAPSPNPPVYPDPSAGGAQPIAQPAAPSYPGAATGYPGYAPSDPNAGYVDPSLPGVPLTPPAGASPDWTPSIGGGTGGFGQVAPSGPSMMSIAELVPQIKDQVEKGDVAGLASMIAQQAGSLLTSESTDIGTSVSTVGSQIQTVLPALNAVVPGLSNMLPQAQAAAVVQLEQQRGGKKQEPVAPSVPAAPSAPVAQSPVAASQAPAPQAPAPVAPVLPEAPAPALPAAPEPQALAPEAPVAPSS